jgi:hypothetical protein
MTIFDASVEMTIFDFGLKAVSSSVEMAIFDASIKMTIFDFRVLKAVSCSVEMTISMLRSR